MWLMTGIGFFSVVEKPGDRDAGRLTVRSRSMADLEALAGRLPSQPAIISGEGTDYPYRIRVDRDELALVVAQLVREIDYVNFKASVRERQGAKRAKAYGKVWGDLRTLEG